MKLNSVTITLVPAPTEEVRELLVALDRGLAAAYDADQQHGPPMDELFRSGIQFFLARAAGEAVGCGGLALLGEYGEVKRLYARQAARGRGISRALLARIEAQASAAGLRQLRLETGVHQTAAMSLYERCGFQRCGPFAFYATLPAHAVAASVFYEKALPRPGYGVKKRTAQ